MGLVPKKKWVEDGTLSEGRGEGERRTYGDSAIRRELREFAGEKQKRRR